MYNKDVDKLGYIDEELDSSINLVAEIDRLRKQKNAVILAHYYQPAEIQQIANFVGDSLALSQRAAETNAKIILFAGVKFMAETAKILSPVSKVLIPDLNAGCSLADSCKYEDFEKFVKKYPNHKVVTYVNTTADIKSLSYICCTSSNALKVCQSIPENEPIIFAPDRNLGGYIKNILNRENMVIWDGCCHVHDQFSVQGILDLKKQYPQAKVISHPECKKSVILISDYVGSTAQLLKYVQTSNDSDFIIATESGILYEMRKAVPNKNLIPAPSENIGCACSECSYMKLTTLKKIYLSLKYEAPEITVDKDLIESAKLPITRMLNLK